ncbi:MAG: protoporphyrinogen oxidase [Chlamydiales bacterium]
MKTQVVILGGGISGLCAAYFLKDRFDVILLEASHRVGGWIHTVKKEGMLFELGPRGFRPSEKTECLVHELNLSLLPANEAAKKRFLLRKGKLTPFSPKILLAYLPALLVDLFAQPAKEDESIAQFFTRHFSRKVAEDLIDPMCRGVFGGDITKLSMESCFPCLWKIDQEFGSILRGMRKKKQPKHKVSLYSFKEGMESLPRALAHALGKRIHLNTPVTKIEPGLVNGIFPADVIISALPFPALQNLLPQLSLHLPWQKITAVNLGWRNHSLPQRGFGFLAPSKEQQPFLGMTWDSQIFPEQSSGTRACLMTHDEPNKAVESALKLLRLPSPDIKIVQEAHIPQYPVGHKKALDALRKQLPEHFYLLGNSYSGVAVNDCVNAAKSLSDALIASR